MGILPPKSKKKMTINFATFFNSIMSIYLFEGLFILFFFIVDCITFFLMKKLSLKKALANFIFWLLVALAFFVITYFNFSEIKAKEFLAGYTLERVLSLDNIFVFYIIFNFFKLNEESRERILFWGIILAIILRAIFIFIGAALIAKFSFLMYIFGAFLIFTGIKLVIIDEAKENDLNKNPVVRFFKKILPTTTELKGSEFTTRIKGKLFFTPAFIVMILVGITDIVFALDSIPAIFGITLDPFIVITANFFSLMGLRAIFSLITHIIKGFYYIKYALCLILVFIGVKMLIVNYIHIPISISLSFILGTIGLAILASVIKLKLVKN